MQGFLGKLIHQFQRAQIGNSSTSSSSTSPTPNTATTPDAEHQRFALEAAGVGTWDWDLRSGQVWWSENMEAVHGLPVGTFQSDFLSFLAELDAEDGEQVLATVEDALEHGSDFRIDYRTNRPNGAQRWLQCKGRVLHDEGGSPRRVTGVCMDVTERRQAEDARHTTEKRHQTLLQHLPVGVYRTTPDGRILGANPALADLVGLDHPKALHQHRIQDFFLEGAVREQHLEHLGNTTLCTAEYQLRRTDKRTIWVRDYPRAVYDEAGCIMYYDGVLVDITERKQAQQHLLDARRHAEEMSLLKSTFLNNISHEFRTPLTAIIGFSDILLEEADGPHHAMVSTIAESSQRLLGTLNSVIDLSMLEAGTLRPEPEWLNLGETIQALTRRYQTAAEQNHLVFEVVPLGEQPQVFLDKAFLDRILSHLLDNAVKFTDAGRLTLRLHIEDDMLSVRVADTGIGMEADFLEKLFEPFNQESRGLDRSYVGAGLGLTITRRLVDLLGGTIKVTSRKHEGTTVEVKLPCQVRAARPERRTGRQRLRVLAVEDSPEILMLLDYMLGARYEVTQAADEETALALARREVFDLVLMDINLGGSRSGLDVMQTLREMPDYDAVPMVAVTAYAMLEDRERFLDAGFDAYLSKPFTPDQLHTTVRRALGVTA